MCELTLSLCELTLSFWGFTLLLRELTMLLCELTAILCELTASLRELTLLLRKLTMSLCGLTLFLRGLTMSLWGFTPIISILGIACSYVALLVVRRYIFPKRPQADKKQPKLILKNSSTLPRHPAIRNWRLHLPLITPHTPPRFRIINPVIFRHKHFRIILISPLMTGNFA